MERIVVVVGLAMLVSGCSGSGPDNQRNADTAKQAAEMCDSFKKAGRTEDAASVCALATDFADAAAASASEEPEASRDPGDWEYVDREDKVRGGASHFANLYSKNAAEFAFPYSGGATLRISLQKIGDRKIDALLRIDKGQFNCRAASGSVVLVKFDSAPAQKFECATPSDGSSDAIFVEPAGRFVDRLRKSKSINIEVEFFQEGSRQFEFVNNGLKW